MWPPPSPITDTHGTLHPYPMGLLHFLLDPTLPVYPKLKYFTLLYYLSLRSLPPCSVLIIYCDEGFWSILSGTFLSCPDKKVKQE